MTKRKGEQSLKGGRDMQKMMKQVQKMQEDMQRIQAELADRTVTGSAGVAW